MYQYRPQNEDELELREGDRVDVMQQCDDGWFVGRWAWRAGWGQVHLRVLGEWAGRQARKGISESRGEGLEKRPERVSQDPRGFEWPLLPAKTGSAKIHGLTTSHPSSPALAAFPKPALCCSHSLKKGEAWEETRLAQGHC